MRLAEATTLISSSGIDPEVREHDPQEDIEALCTLAEQAQQFSPIVGLEQLERKLWAGRTLLQPECILLDISGIGQLFNGEEQLLKQISQWLEQQNYFGCLGIAGSTGAAWGVANYALRSTTNNSHKPTEQTLASNKEAPQPRVPMSRYLVVPPKEDERALEHLPIAALRLSPDTIQSLHRLGIHTIGQLNTLPRDGMATRLGEQLLSRWDQAFDRKEEPVVSLYGSPDWCLEETLEYPTENRATVEEIASRLCNQLSKRLTKRGEGAVRIVFRLDFIQEESLQQTLTQPMILQLGLFRPSNDSEHLAKLLIGQLEQALRGRTQAPIWRLSLQATLTAALVWRQASLFDSGEAENRNQIARLVDTLSSRLGRKQVLQARTRREAQPELAFNLSPMTGLRIDGTQQDTVKKLSTRLAKKKVDPNSDDPLRRPSHLFEQPVEIEVGFEDPESLRFAAPPDRFKYQGKMHAVLEARGPERLESGWWRGPSSRRDYYRVQSHSGSWWWLFRDLNNGKWHLHGVFD